MKQTLFQCGFVDKLIVGGSRFPEVSVRDG